MVPTDNAADTLDSIVFSSGVTLMSAAGITLQSQTGDMSDAGTLLAFKRPQ